MFWQDQVLDPIDYWEKEEIRWECGGGGWRISSFSRNYIVGSIWVVGQKCGCLLGLGRAS